jgi:hypothetical protein
MVLVSDDLAAFRTDGETELFQITEIRRDGLDLCFG